LNSEKRISECVKISRNIMKSKKVYKGISKYYDIQTTIIRSQKSFFSSKNLSFPKFTNLLFISLFLSINVLLLSYHFIINFFKNGNFFFSHKAQITLKRKIKNLKDKKKKKNRSFHKIKDIEIAFL